jgi:hypothetical protein
MIISSSVSSDGNGCSSIKAYVCSALTVRARFDFLGLRGIRFVSGYGILRVSWDSVVSGSQSKELAVLCGDFEGKSCVEIDAA